MKGCSCEGLGRPVCGSGSLPHRARRSIVENLKPGKDISRLQGLSLEGHRPYLEESIYAFAELASMDRLRELVEISEPLAREAAGPAGVPGKRQNPTPSGRLEKVFSGRQVFLFKWRQLQFSTHACHGTPWDYVERSERRKKISPRTSILFKTESEGTDWREKLKHSEGQSCD